MRSSTATCPTLGAGLFVALGSKVLIKSGVVLLSRSSQRRQRSPALGALLVDARNDAIVGTTSIVGLLLSTWLEVPSLDAWLAIPVAVYIGWSAVDLGLENANLLMGVSPDDGRCDELAALAGEIEGARVESIQARHHGQDLDVWLEVRVDPNASVREAHDIGEAVERRLREEPDVCRAVVHVDADDLER